MNGEQNRISFNSNRRLSLYCSQIRAFLRHSHPRPM